MVSSVELLLLIVIVILCTLSIPAQRLGLALITKIPQVAWEKLWMQLNSQEEPKSEWALKAKCHEKNMCTDEYNGLKQFWGCSQSGVV